MTVQQGRVGAAYAAYLPDVARREPLASVAGPLTRDAVTLFADLAGFTGLSERLAAPWHGRHRAARFARPPGHRRRSRRRRRSRWGCDRLRRRRHHGHVRVRRSLGRCAGRGREHHRARGGCARDADARRPRRAEGADRDRRRLRDIGGVRGADAARARARRPWARRSGSGATERAAGRDRCRGRQSRADAAGSRWPRAGLGRALAASGHGAARGVRWRPSRRAPARDHGVRLVATGARGSRQLPRDGDRPDRRVRRRRAAVLGRRQGRRLVRRVRDSRSRTRTMQRERCTPSSSCAA